MDSLTTFRVKHGKEHPYFMFSRRTAQNKEISYEAAGMLAYLLSKPDDWQIILSDLMRENCGRDKVLRILRELQDHYYLKKDPQEHDEEGRFSPALFYTYEEPYTENPLTVEPLTANPILHKIEETESTYVTDLKSVAPAPPSGASVLPSWVNRVPKETLTKTVGDASVGKTYSRLESMILSRTHRPSLTENQRDELDRNVLVYPVSASGADPLSVDSPNELYEKNELFRTFADEKIRQMAAHGANNSRIIHALCKYDLPQGWLTFERTHTQAVEPVVESKPSVTVGGATRKVGD